MFLGFRDFSLWIFCRLKPAADQQANIDKSIHIPIIITEYSSSLCSKQMFSTAYYYRIGGCVDLIDLRDFNKQKKH